MHWRCYGRLTEISCGTENACWKHISRYGRQCSLNYTRRRWKRSTMLCAMQGISTSSTNRFAFCSFDVLYNFRRLLHAPSVKLISFLNINICSFYVVFLVLVNIQVPPSGETITNWKPDPLRPISDMLTLHIHIEPPASYSQFLTPFYVRYICWGVRWRHWLGTGPNGFTSPLPDRGFLFNTCFAYCVSKLYEIFQ